MPYASPSATTTTTITPTNDTNDLSFRPSSRVGGHRRSRSVNDAQVPTSSSEPPARFVEQHSNVAAFSPLMPPRRARSSATFGQAAKPRAPVFDFGDDHSSSGSGDADESRAEESSLGLSGVQGAATNGLRLDTANLPPATGAGAEDTADPAIPFPTLSPDPPSPPKPADSAANTISAIPFPESGALSAVRSGANTPTRSPSSPIIRKSNGSIVKPSLKSSLSSGNIPALNSASPTSGTQSRSFTRSAPSTPSLKAVHFTEKDSVVLFEKSQRPVAVSLGSSSGAPPLRGGLSGGESETETERDSDALGLFGSYPFPSMPPAGARIEIARGKSSNIAAVPGTLNPAMLQTSDARVHLESVALSAPVVGNNDEILKGTILVENVTYGKLVHVRFTLDEWQTTSEVGANYVGSLPLQSSLHTRSQSEPFLPTSSSEMGGRLTTPPKQWDRFGFSINLASVRHLHTRRLFLVVRYSPVEWNGAEFWDNNNGQNYCFVFEREKPSTKKQEERRSSMPVSPAPSATAAHREMDAKTVAAATERPVPRLPSVSIGKSASAPALATQHFAHHHGRHHPHTPHHQQQLHHVPEDGHPHSKHGSELHHEQERRERSGSGSSYPAINLKLSNYISPTNVSPPAARFPSPISPQTNGRAENNSLSVDTSASSSSRQHQADGAPLSPPESPVMERSPGSVVTPLTPSSSSSDGNLTPPHAPPRAISSSNDDGACTPSQARFSSPPTTVLTTKSITPPQSAEASPEGVSVPLPQSASPSSSDSDKDGLRMKQLRHSGAHENGARMSSSPQRAPAPQGLDFAGRFNHRGAPAHRSGAGAGPQAHMHPHPHHFHHAHQHNHHGHGKFTVGGSSTGSGSNSSTPLSSLAGTPTLNIGSNMGSPFGSPFDASRTNGGGGSMNNAPAEFLQKFCFFGSPPTSPTTQKSSSSLFSPSSRENLNNPVMLGGEVIPGATVSMGSFASAAGALGMDTGYNGLPYAYGSTSGTSSPMRTDLRA